jgi:hypothetical protein
VSRAGLNIQEQGFGELCGEGGFAHRLDAVDDNALGALLFA